ncbi:LPD38 domain-containing protein [Aeromonas caviae]|uniref:LPD38 domain-containing protein n=1 Tax=Aeromonas caviae TaxID=648 RepID=UPI002B24BB24|nr:LPD38 domain-containing protein [Aeromonas caviae]MEA9426255.1 LPD38 domain-containing protein [Aeromonas caviae]MEA9431145.1 LPD38 domain-containing protein [Aeromonas caviae]
MDKPGLRDALPQPQQSDTRNDPFWGNLDSSLSAAAAAPPQSAQPTAKRDLDVGLGDVARGVGAGALELVGGIGELARQASNFGKENAGKQGGDYLEQARANMANKLSPVLDAVAGAGDLAQGGAESLTEGMSADAKEALGRRLVDETPEGRLTLGDGAGDIDVWAMKMAQGVGSLLPTLAAGGVTGLAAKVSIGRAVTASMIKRGATQEVAEAVAAKAVSKIATGASVTTGVTGSVGSAGVNARDTVLGMSFDELAGSDTFRQAFTRIDQDQQTAHLSDEEKLGLAREETANLASRATMSDAKVWGAAAMGSMMGDAMLFKMLAGKAATGGVLKGAAKGAAGEGISETLEEGVQQYAVNESLNEVAAADIDPMKGVMSSAIEGGLIGMGTGGAVGAVGGARGGKHASQEDGVGTDPVSEPSAPVTEGAAGPAVDPNFASVPLEEGEQAPSASQAEGELNPLGPSASQFDELRDVPAYLRRDDTAARFKGMAADSEVQRALAGEFGQSVQELVASQMQAGDQGKSLYERAQAGELGLDPFAGNKSAQQVAMENQRLALPLKDVIFAGDANAKPKGEAVAAPGDHDDQQAGPGPQFRGGERTRWQSGQEGDVLPPEASSTKPAGELPGAVIEGEAREVGNELPHRNVVYGNDLRAEQQRAADLARRERELNNQPLQIGQSETLFAGGTPGADPRNSAYTPPRLSRDQVDTSMGEQSTRDPRSPVAQSIEQAGSATDSVFGPLKSLRITRKGKPFASEKEAAMASRKGKEMPVPLNGGGFGVAEIAEVEQVKAAATTQSSAPQLDDISVTNPNQPSDLPANRVSAETVTAPSATAGEASQLAPAIDTGYREVIPVNQPQAEVSNEPVTPVPAIGREGQRDQPGAGEPAAAGAGPAVAGLTDRAGSGDRADLAAPAPVPDGQQQNDPTLTAPATDAGAAVSEAVQPEPVAPEPAAAPTPWAEAIDNPDGTITLKGEVPIIKQWAKDNGVKAIPGKGGLVVAKSFTAKVRGLAAPAANEPSAQVEAARGGVVREPTEVDLIDRDLLKEHAGRWKYRSAVGAGWFTSNTKEGAIDRAREAYRRAFEKGNPVPTREERWEQSEREFAGRMDNRFGGMTINELEKRHQNLGGTIADLQLAGRHEMNGNGGRRTGAAVANEGARQAGQEKMDLERYIQLRREREEMAGSAPTRMIEEARAEVAPVDASTLADDEAIAVADELGLEHGDNPDDARWRLDGVKPQVLADTVDRVRNPSQPAKFERSKDNPNIVAAPPVEGEPETRPNRVRMSQQRVAAVGEQAGLTADEVAGIVSDFRAEYKGARSLDFIVGQTQEDLYGPEGSPEQIGWSDGGYLPGKQQVHLFADSITRRAGRLGQDIHQGDGGEGGVSGDPVLDQSFRPASRDEQGVGGAERAKAEVVTTLRHEVLGHYGLDTFTPSDKEALLQKLIDAKQEKWIAPVWQQIAGDSFYGKQSALHQAEEVFAHIAEKELPPRTIRAWSDIKTLFSRLLRKVGIVKGPIKEHELDSLIRAVGKGIRNGERTRQNIRSGNEVIGKQADGPAKDDKPERIIRFSKQAMAQGDKPAKHLTRKEAELVSHGWFKQYRGASGIKVQIHATQAELEESLGLDTKDGLIRRAAFDDDAGTLHVAADTISDPKRMREILRHEVLAHYGLANVLGDGEYTKLMSRLIQSQKDPSMKPVWDWVNTHYADEDIGTKAEEVVAHLAELEQGAWGRGWDRVVAWVTRALRAVGFVPDGITAAETRSLIEGLGKKLRKADAEVGVVEGERLWFSAERSPWGKDFPEVILHGRLADATSHPDYAAAKGGDDAAARRLVRDVLSPDAIGKLKALVGVRPAIALGVHAEEAVSRNAIPSAMADILGKVLGIEVDLDIMQSAKVGRTAQDGFGRLANQPGFDGPVRNDKPYLIMDDTLTQGGTLANLKGYIENRGGEVLAATALTGKQYSAKIAIDSSTLEQLRDQYDGTGLEAWWHNRFGYGFDSLTESEGRYLLRAKDADKVRDRVAAAGPQTSARSEYESARDDGSLPPNGLKFSQTNSAADEALQKLNLGPKPDIIDKTKASLNKLRQVDRGVVSSWIDRVIKKANTEVLDALAPIKYAEEAAGITDAADSGYVAARMATGAASTMQATMLYGLPEWNDGVIQRKAGTGEKDALLGIFADLGADLHNWLGWMAGHRAELLMAQGRENLLDANDIAALKGQGKGKEAKFLDAKARWNRLNAATLDLAQEAGLFTKEARAEFESEWYIPFFRESDDGDVIAPFKTKGIANQNAGIKKLKGGEANTNDLLENIFTSTSKLIDASMKNMAAQKTVWNLADTGIIEVIPKPNKMDYQALANGKDRIMVKLEGEDYMIRVEDPDLYRAMTFFDRKPFGAMVNVAAKAKRLLTAGVTASPEFMLRNFLRDSLSSWAISKDGFRPVIDSIKGVKKTLAMDGSTIDVMFSGASFLGGYVNGNDPEAMADTVRKSLRRKGMTPEQIARYEKSIIRNAAQAKGVVANVWEKYNRYGEAFENANREAVYAAAIKAGKSHAQAAFESKDLMDFSMLGASRTMQVMTQLLPFFNARVQGLGKLSRELRDNPREIAKRAGMITAASLALLALNWDDERYEKLPDWDKDANWHFWIGDEEFRIPKPFEIGVLFGTIPERMVRAMGGKDTGAQLGKAIVRAVGETFALNPTPQIVKPLVESYFNYDAFRGIPIENAQDLAVQAEARYNEQTSLMMRELGETLGMSPKKLEHLLIGYTGTIGSYVMAAADGLIRAGTPGESASWRADEIPLVKAVYRGSGPAKSTQHMEEFYRMLNEVNQLKRTIDQYRSEGLTDKARELLEEQGGILKSRRSLSRTQQQVRVVRNKIELIQRDRKMTAEEKRRRIDEMLARRNDLVYQAVNKNKANWE